jgi:amidase
MTTNEILSLDALSLSNAIRDKKLTCAKVMEATIERIAQVNCKHNAIILLRDTNHLLALARKADQTPRKGWLHGIPIAIKDLSNVEGIPTTMGGSSLFEDFVPESSDSFVENMVNAGKFVCFCLLVCRDWLCVPANSLAFCLCVDIGAIVIGKTNTPECGLGSHTYNNRWGTTTNPFDTSKSAGGSSGGAATAVATGMLCLADGSDMMGSLRNPAGWNNLYSHRPTSGIIVGALPCEKNPLPYPISTPGPIARNPVDCALLLETMAGKASFDASDLRNGDTIDGTRIGWLGDWNGSLAFEEGILRLCRSSLDAINSQGVVVDDTMMPLPEIWHAWNSIRFAMTAYTYTSMFDAETLLGDSSSIKEDMKWEIHKGLSVSNEELRHAKKVQEEYSTFLDGLFEKYDFLALPSAQVWPFPASQAWPRAIGDTKMDTYHRWMEVCVPVSFGGLPCSTVPAGFGDNGLPIGVQLFARRGEDMKLFRLAMCWHELTHYGSTAREEP